MLQHGENIDLRKIPSVVGGGPKTRHGIVLAKSIPAKRFNIRIRETLYEAIVIIIKILLISLNK